LRRLVIFFEISHSYCMKSLINLFLLLFICFSCSKEETNEYEPYLKGNIVGYALLSDEYLNMLDDHSGITVYTEPGRKYSGKTDITGRFEIKGVPTGTYNLSFEKEGFNTMKYPEVHHLGGKPTVISPYLRFVLYPDITAQITNMTFQNNQVNIELDKSGNFLYARLYFSTTDGFSLEDGDYIADIRVYGDGGYLIDLPDLPFGSGTQIYCRGCLYTYQENALEFGFQNYAECIDYYYDEAQGITVYPNITDESDQYAFIKP
jgi:hypothetical protein